METLSQWWSGGTGRRHDRNQGQDKDLWAKMYPPHPITSQRLASGARYLGSHSSSSSEASNSSTEAPSAARFVRLDSLEDASTMEESERIGRRQKWQAKFRESGPTSVGAKFHEEKVTEREKNWFSARHSNAQVPGHFSPSKKIEGGSFSVPYGSQSRAGAPSPFPDQFRPERSYIHPPPPIQVPYNLTKGAYEIWPSVPCPQQQADIMYHVIEGILPEGFIPEGFIPSDAQNSGPSLPVELGNSMVTMVGQVISSMTSFISSPATPVHPGRHPLNPNAPSFVPPSNGSHSRRAGDSLTTALNPNARAFYPSKSDQHVSEDEPWSSGGRNFKAGVPTINVTVADSSAESLAPKSELTPTAVLHRKVTPPHSLPPSECSTPVMDEDTLKAVGERQSTPWVGPKETPERCATSDSSLVDADEDANATSNVEEEVSFSSVDCSQDNIVKRCARSISTSSCESSSGNEDEDDSMIEFSCSPSNGEASREVQSVGSRRRAGHVSGFAGNDSSGDDREDSDQEDEDDDGWDEVDDPSATNWDDFEECGLVCPMQNAVKKYSGSPDSYGVPVLNRDSERIREANQKWSKGYHECQDETKTIPHCDMRDAHKKVVGFAHEDAWSYLYEDPEDAAALREARISDLKTRQADKRRMNDMMEKVFDPEHRKEMFKIIYGEELCE